MSGVNRGGGEWGGIQRYLHRVKKVPHSEACIGIIEVNSDFFSVSVGIVRDLKTFEYQEIPRKYRWIPSYCYRYVEVYVGLWDSRGIKIPICDKMPLRTPQYTCLSLEGFSGILP